MPGSAVRVDRMCALDSGWLC